MNGWRYTSAPLGTPVRCLCRAGERLGPDFRGFASGDNAGTLRLWSVTEGATPGSVGATELESIAASESYLLAVAESAQGCTRRGTGARETVVEKRCSRP